MSDSYYAPTLPVNRPSRLERDLDGYNGTDEASTNHYWYASSYIYFQTNARFESVPCWLPSHNHHTHTSHETWNPERFKLTDNQVKMVRHQAICDNFYWRRIVCFQHSLPKIAKITFIKKNVTPVDATIIHMEKFIRRLQILCFRWHRYLPRVNLKWLSFSRRDLQMTVTLKVTVI